MSSDDLVRDGPRTRQLHHTSPITSVSGKTSLQADQLLLPVFVAEGIDQPRGINSMPGVNQHTIESLKIQTQQAVTQGIAGLMVFGVPIFRDEHGSGALDSAGILPRALDAIKSVAGDELLAIPDVCLDEFTDHGHCGVLRADGTIDHRRTVEIYAQMACLMAAHGADFVGLSGMMDGQVSAVRLGLDEAGRREVGILAYSAKFASSLYGPFRDAVESTLVGDRKAYQLDPCNAGEGVRRALLDEQAGADVVMVKPGLPYLDILQRVKQQVNVPVASYHVSGEYAMLEAAAANGWIDRDSAIMESLLGFRRAGADLIVTYHAQEAARLLQK